MTEEEEKLCRALTDKGFEVLRRGWPDFLVLNGTHGFAIELKIGNDKVSEDQTRMHEALARFGIRVFVAREDFLTAVRKKGRALLTPHAISALKHEVEVVRHELQVQAHTLSNLEAEIDAATALLDGEPVNRVRYRDPMWMLGGHPDALQRYFGPHVVPPDADRTRT
jgi:Holliday junction resolvase